MDRYDRSNVTGRRYGSRRNQEEEEDQGEDLREEEDGQMETEEEVADTRKRQCPLLKLLLLPLCCQQKYQMSVKSAHVSNVCVSLCRCESVC